MALQMGYPKMQQNAVYKEQVNFSTGENVHLRNIYAPADFTDLQLQVKNANEKDPDTETHPVIQGFFTGFADSTAAIQSPITLTFEFNVVFEYTPVPALYQMVERKSAVVNQMKVQKAENAVSKVDTGLDPDSLSRMVAISQADPTTLRQIGYSQPQNERSSYQTFLRDFGSNVLGKAAATYGPRLGAALIGQMSRAPVKLARTQGSVSNDPPVPPKEKETIELTEEVFQFGNHTKMTSGNQPSKRLKMN